MRKTAKKPDTQSMIFESFASEWSVEKQDSQAFFTIQDLTYLKF